MEVGEMIDPDDVELTWAELDVLWGHVGLRLSAEDDAMLKEIEEGGMPAALESRVDAIFGRQGKLTT